MDARRCPVENLEPIGYQEVVACPSTLSWFCMVDVVRQYCSTEIVVLAGETNLLVTVANTDLQSYSLVLWLGPSHRRERSSWALPEQV